MLRGATPRVLRWGVERQGAALHSCRIGVTGVQARHAGNGAKCCGGVCRGGADVKQRLQHPQRRPRRATASACGFCKGAGAALWMAAHTVAAAASWSCCHASHGLSRKVTFGFKTSRMCHKMQAGNLLRLRTPEPLAEYTPAHLPVYSTGTAMRIPFTRGTA